MDRAAFALLCLFVFVMPWEKSLYIPGFGTAARLVGILAVAAAAARGRPRGPNLALAAAAAFLAWGSLTVLWSLDPAATLARASTFAQLFVMAWLVWDLGGEPARQRRLLQAYVAGSVAASAATMLRYAQNIQTYYRRYAAPGFDPNDLALTVALAIPMAFYLALRSRGWARWFNYAAVAMSCAAVLLAASRASMVAAFAAFVFPALVWRDSPRTGRAAAAVLLAFFILGGARLAPAASRERLSTLGTELTRGTLHKRTTIWKAGLRAVKQRPVRGVGWGAYPDAVEPELGVPPVAGHEYVAHNSLLSVLVETGLAGFALYALLLAVLAVYVWAMPHVERSLWAVTLAVWLAGAATLTWEHRKPTWLIFALIMAAWARAFQPEKDGAA